MESRCRGAPWRRSWGNEEGWKFKGKTFHDATKRAKAAIRFEKQYIVRARSCKLEATCRELTFHPSTFGSTTGPNRSDGIHPSTGPILRWVLGDAGPTRNIRKHIETTNKKTIISCCTVVVPVQAANTKPIIIITTLTRQPIRAGPFAKYSPCGPYAWQVLRVYWFT